MQNIEHFTVFPEYALQRFEIRFWQDRRAVTALIIGKHPVKLVNIVGNGAGQPVLDSGANHGALLARDVFHVLVHVRINGFAESDVNILAGPVSVNLVQVFVLEMIHFKKSGQALRFRVKQGLRRVGTGRDPAVNTKRQGRQSVPKNRVLHFHKRQYP